MASLPGGTLKRSLGVIGLEVAANDDRWLLRHT